MESIILQSLIWPVNIITKSESKMEKARFDVVVIPRNAKKCSRSSFAKISQEKFPTFTAKVSFGLLCMISKLFIYFKNRATIHQNLSTLRYL
jgi:hypothetical protein